MPFGPGATARMEQAIGMLRLYLRDYPHLNRLISGEESSDRFLSWAILDTLDDFNATPPLISPTSIATFPSPSLLREGAAARVLESVSILGTRNYINFSDGGTSVSFTANLPLIQNMASMLRNSYEQKKLRLKTAVNISQGFGAGVHSDYLMLSGNWYGIGSLGYGTW